MATKQDKTLLSLRRELEAVDEKIVAAVAKRMRIIEKIGAHKRAKNLRVVDQKQQNKQKKLWQKRANKKRLSKKLVTGLYKTLHDHSVALERKAR